MERIGIQELIQHVGRYVDRARHGETIDITEDGATIARLTPVMDDDATLDVLIAQGLVNPPTGSLDELLETPGVAGPADAAAAGRTTTELARRLEISPATVSYQTAVLRRAGLITTGRDGRAVRHRLTPLGRRTLHHAG